MSDDDSTVGPLQVCPNCGGAVIEVVEDVSDEVIVYGCQRCGTTWAHRRDQV